MVVFARGLSEFRRGFPSGEACAESLALVRRPNGLVCRAGSHDRGWLPEHRLITYECAARGKQASATIGTVMRRLHMTVKTRFWAAYFIVTHPDGLSTLQAKLGIRSYKTAWVLARASRAL